MTTEEKLKHFKAAALEEARQESTAAIEEHRRALEKLFQEHTVDKDRQAALEVKTETDRLKTGKQHHSFQGTSGDQT